MTEAHALLLAAQVQGVQQLQLENIAGQARRLEAVALLHTQVAHQEVLRALRQEEAAALLILGLLILGLQVLVVQELAGLAVGGVLVAVVLLRVVLGEADVKLYNYLFKILDEDTFKSFNAWCTVHSINLILTK
jgi:hypothetical protein